MEEPDVEAPIRQIDLGLCNYCKRPILNTEISRVAVCQNPGCSDGLHFKCAEKLYGEAKGRGIKCANCDEGKLFNCVVHTYKPSMLHGLWHSIRGGRRRYIPVDSPAAYGSYYEEISSTKSEWGARENRLAWWSEKLILFVSVLCVFGVVGVMLDGGFDWRLEIGYWTSIAGLFFLALTMSPDCPSYFYDPNNVKHTEGGLSRDAALKTNGWIFYMHIGMLAYIGLTFASMMSLSTNIYSQTWNGILISGFFLFSLMLAFSRKRRVAWYLSTLNFMSYKPDPSKIFSNDSE